MITVKQLLTAKSAELHSISPDISVYDALKVMADVDVGALLVTNGNRLVGIFTERDYARKVILQGKSSRSCIVGDTMVRDVIYVSPSNRIDECMALMTEKRVRHLPVLEEGGLVGIVSIGDVVKQIISEQEFTIRELEKYIQGGY